MAARPNELQQWFAKRKWGVFLHYLDSVQNGGGNFHNSRGYHTEWEDCVADLDVSLLAHQLHQTGVGYVVFTVQQGSRFFCAPNTSFDVVAGYQPGEACSKRDLIDDLSSALTRWGIPLFLCFSGEGPYLDDQAMTGFYGRPARFSAEGDHVNERFVQNWVAVLQEYAMRYGSRISGWWMDGMYQSIGYTPELIAPFCQAVKDGNPYALFAANYHGCVKNPTTVQVPGVGQVMQGDFYHTIAPPTPWCDYTAGEVVTLDVFPTSQLVEGAQAHVLSFLGIPKHPIEVYGGWGARGCKYSTEYLLQYVRQVNACGGVVTLEVCLYRDGRLDPDQLRMLKMLPGMTRGA